MGSPRARRSRYLPVHTKNANDDHDTSIGSATPMSAAAGRHTDGEDGRRNACIGHDCHPPLGTCARITSSRTRSRPRACTHAGCGPGRVPSSNHRAYCCCSSSYVRLRLHPGRLCTPGWMMSGAGGGGCGGGGATTTAGGTAPCTTARRPTGPAARAMPRSRSSTCSSSSSSSSRAAPTTTSTTQSFFRRPEVHRQAEAAAAAAAIAKPQQLYAAIGRLSQQRVFARASSPHLTGLMISHGSKQGHSSVVRTAAILCSAFTSLRARAVPRSIY